MFERARQPAFFDHCRAVFRRHGFEPRTLREPEDHHVLLAGVANAEAFALLPRSFTALKRTGGVYRPLKEGDELAVSVGVVAQPDDGELRELLAQFAS